MAKLHAAGANTFSKNNIWSRFGALWVPVGSLWAGLGSPPSNLKLNVHRVRSLHIKSSLLEHPTAAAGAVGATETGEVVSRTAARSPPPTRAGGQDDGSYTNSLKLWPGYRHFIIFN